MYPYRLIVAVVACALLTACGAPVGLAPEPAPSPVPCSQQAAAFIAQIEPLAREWDDANTLADSTPRASLSAQIDKLQATRRRATDLQAPDCAVAAKQSLVSAMDATIKGYIAFLAQKTDSEVKPLFTLAANHMDTFQQDMRALQANTPLPAAESPLIDGLGVSQAAIREIYQKEGLTFSDSPLADGRPRSLGTTENNLKSIELIGPPENVRQASIYATMIGGGQDPLNRMKETMRTFLKTVAPDWGAGDAWLTTAMNAPGGLQTAVTRGRVVSYQRSAPAGGDTFSLVVQVP